jgi:hypothetical protein
LKRELSSQRHGKDLTGREFGFLTVLERDLDSTGPHWRWLCKCACGKTKIVRSPDLLSGSVRSCGCFKRRIRPSSGKSRFKGVSWSKSKKKWIAQISIDKKHLQSGSFDDEVEAAMAYNAMARKHLGDFAYLNSIPSETLSGSFNV